MNKQAFLMVPFIVYLLSFAAEKHQGNMSNKINLDSKYCFCKSNRDHFHNQNYMIKNDTIYVCEAYLGRVGDSVYTSYKITNDTVYLNKQIKHSLNDMILEDCLIYRIPSKGIKYIVGNEFVSIEKSKK